MLQGSDYNQTADSAAIASVIVQVGPAIAQAFIGYTSVEPYRSKPVRSSPNSLISDIVRRDSTPLADEDDSGTRSSLPSRSQLETVREYQAAFPRPVDVRLPRSRIGFEPFRLLDEHPPLTRTSLRPGQRNRERPTRSLPPTRPAARPRPGRAGPASSSRPSPSPGPTRSPDRASATARRTFGSCSPPRPFASADRLAATQPRAPAVQPCDRWVLTRRCGRDGHPCG